MTERPFALHELPLVPACVRWWIGEWQKCSASCGRSGQTKRTVLCIQAVSAEEQKALPSRECEHVPKPASLSSCNTHIPCPADWTAGNWSKVSLDQHYEPFVYYIIHIYYTDVSIMRHLFPNSDSSSSLDSY